MRRRCGSTRRRRRVMETIVSMGTAEMLMRMPSVLIMLGSATATHRVCRLAAHTCMSVLEGQRRAPKRTFQPQRPRPLHPLHLRLHLLVLPILMIRCPEGPSGRYVGMRAAPCNPTRRTCTPALLRSVTAATLPLRSHTPRRR